MKALITGKWGVITGIVLAILAGLGVWQRDTLLAWHHVRQLAYSSSDNRDDHVRKVVALGESAVPSILSRMRDTDSGVCANLQHALFLMAQQWGIADARTRLMIDQLHVRFEGLSLAGQKNSLELVTSILQLEGERPLPAPLTKTASDLLLSAEKRDELRGPALALAAEMLDCVQPGQLVDSCREMALRGFKDTSPGARAAAARLLLRQPMRKEKELITSALVLLKDQEPSVRRAALLALASETEIVREDHLLPLLHDDDGDVQNLCEIALRKRGLSDDELRIARMITDKNWATRVRVPNHLRRLPDLNVSECLRRLSLDPEPAVRAAAVRAAGEGRRGDLSQRLREMADSDPSPTVRQNAIYYLQQCRLVSGE